MKRTTTKHPVIRRIEDELIELLEKHGYELVEATYGGRGDSRALNVYMDKPGGVSVAECRDMAEQLSVLLDVLDAVPGNYNLIVSSPGVERALTKKEHFERFSGRKASISFVQDGDSQTWEGRLRGTEPSIILMEVSDEIRRIPADSVEEAHLVFDPDLARDDSDGKAG
ncbi:MAG: ribosome maturation factor RimP [Armatimonadota bacterium]